MGENFVRENVADTQVDNDSATIEDNIQFKDKVEEEEDDMNDFFDEFEKATGGENFRRQA